MDQIVSKFTVFFEEPFWIGLYERESKGKYEVCKITFGPEPKEVEIYQFLQLHTKDFQFSPSIDGKRTMEKRINPKRMQRKINKLLETPGIGTKAQQALKLQQEERKVERRIHSREEREAEQERRFALRQEKRKAKHRGH